MRRRDLIKATTGAVIGGAALGTAGSVTAANQPEMGQEPAHDSNYTSANRSTGDVQWITFHTIQGSAAGAINWFKHPGADVSSHFVVDEDGTVTKMVSPEDVAWTNGNPEYNETAITIQLAGYADETEFSEATYESVAKLCSHLCTEYDVPVRHPTFDVAPCSADGGEGGLIGHSQVPSSSRCSESKGIAPGSTWDWDRLLERIDGGSTNARGTVQHGQRVQTTANLVIHTDPDLSAPDVFTAPEGSAAEIVDGPVDADGYTWWKLSFDDGHEGWGVEEYLEATSESSDPRRSCRPGDVVAANTNLAVRADPHLGGNVLHDNPEGTRGVVLSEPESGNGYSWRKVKFVNGVVGWIVQDDVDRIDATLINGQRVKTTADLVVHDDHDLSAPNVFTAPEGSVAETIAGPVDADGYTWWMLSFEDGHRGWAVQEYLGAAPDASESVSTLDTPGTFAPGDVVETTSPVHARDEPALIDNVLRKNPTGVRGTVLAGPRSSDEYTWWLVSWENDVVGWSVERFLDSSDVTFLHGQRVRSTTRLNIHHGPSLSSPNVWKAPEATAGYTLDGPREADGYTWWKVGYIGGEQGWCVEKYLDSAPLPPMNNQDDGAFELGEKVHPTRGLNVREKGSLGGTKLGRVHPEDTGWIKDGYVTNHGYRWWKIEWKQGVTGWSAEQYLESGDGSAFMNFTKHTDLTEHVDVTGEELDDAIEATSPGSPLVGLGETFVSVQDEHDINAIYQAAHAAHESGWGRSNIAEEKNNLFGWGAVDSDPYDGAKKFDSKEDCVEYVMEEIDEKYLTEGGDYYTDHGPTLRGMNTYYASDKGEDSPLGDEAWWCDKIVAVYLSIAEEL